MAESIHKKLERVRKPRVHITYEVETEGAIEVKELPFVVGVVGDFSGNPTAPLKPLEQRKFINIDRDNFNSMDDFDPAKIVSQVEPLRKLLEVRNKLRDLQTTVDRSDSLEHILEDV